MHRPDEHITLDAIRHHSLRQLVESFEAEATPTASRLVSSFTEFASAYGLNTVAVLSPPPVGEITLDCVTVNTRPANWLCEYLAHNFQRHDPVVSHAPKWANPFSWADILAGADLKANEVRVMNHSADHGINEGFVIPIYSKTHRISIVSLAGSRFDDTPVVRSRLTLASVYLHNRLAALEMAACRPLVSLTRREREILQWIAAGKSDWQIGQILSVSHKTVNYHVENVKKKFGVATRIQAIVAAIREGRIEP